MTLTLSEILNAEDDKLHCVTVPEWGGDVYIKVISGTQRDAYENHLLKCMKGDRLVENRGLKIALLRLALCDQQGKLLIQTDKDAKALGDKAAPVLQRLFEKSQRINGLGDEAVDDAAKNLQATPADDSG